MFFTDLNNKDMPLTKYTEIIPPKQFIIKYSDLY